MIALNFIKSKKIKFYKSVDSLYKDEKEIKRLMKENSYTTNDGLGNISTEYDVGIMTETDEEKQALTYLGLLK